jgi:ribosomal protein S6--L-glutamate ligase
MRLIVLSRSASIYSTQRLVEVARARGHQVRVLDPMDCELFLSGREGTIYSGRKKLGRVEAVLPRFGQSATIYGLAVLNHFSLQGVVLLNDAQGIAQARNKLRCLQMLALHGIEVPATVMARDAADLRAMVDLVGGVPVLVKMLQGNDRMGVMVCESLQSMSATLDTVLGLGQQFIVQQYVRRARGRDVRALVVGGKVVAAVLRKARAGRLSSSLAHGARLTPVELTPKELRVAVESARVIGLEVAAVDMIEVGGSTRVFEVNASPSLKDLEKVTGRDLATPIIELAEKRTSGHTLHRRRAAG